MPLVMCPDCGKEVSNEAAACPDCGRLFARRNRGIYIILGLFFGFFGSHNFYAGYYLQGFIQLIISALLGWIYVGFLITGIWLIIDLFTVKKDADGHIMK